MRARNQETNSKYLEAMLRRAKKGQCIVHVVASQASPELSSILHSARQCSAGRKGSVFLSLDIKCQLVLMFLKTTQDYKTTVNITFFEEKVNYGDFIDDFGKQYPWSYNELLKMYYVVDCSYHQDCSDQDMVEIFEKNSATKQIDIVMHIVMSSASHLCPAGVFCLRREQPICSITFPRK